MSVRFFYVDESYDAKKFCLSAISIRYIDWRQSFKLVQAYRRELKAKYGLYIRQEIHARELIKPCALLGYYSFSRIANVVFKTVSGLSEMLSILCSTRNWANSG